MEAALPKPEDNQPGADEPRRSSPVSQQAPSFLVRVAAPAVAVLILLLSSLYFGLNRFVAPDEGFYLYAARMVQEGLVPYRDFFFPQAPLSPYLFAGWFALVGRGWIEARIFAALVSAAACLTLARAASSIYGRRVALWSLPVFAVCIGVQVWMPTGKNTGLSALFLALSVDAFLRRGSAGRAAFWIGMSALTRATMAPAAVFLLLPLSLERGAYLRQLRSILLGAAIPCLIALLFFALDPFNFWQGNLGYHLERTGFSERYIANQRWVILKGLFGGKTGVGLGGAQFGVLVLGSVLSMVFCWRKGARFALLPALALMLAAVNFLPEPTYVQYFSVVAFLLVPAAVAGFSLLLVRSGALFPGGGRVVVPVVGALSLALFTFLGKGDTTRFLETGESVAGVGKFSKSSWRIGTMKDVALAVDAANTSGKPVLSGWPGYLLESRAPALAGTENHFAFAWAAANSFSPAEQAARHIASQERAVQAFVDGEADIAVAYAGPKRSRPLLDALKARGAKRVAKVGWVEIVGRKTP